MEINKWVIGLLGTVLLPILAALFKREIAALYKAWAIYNSRPFDRDRNPNTPDQCQLYNPATGDWEEVLIEKYSFSLNRDKRGVFICHAVTDGAGGPTRWARERIPFDVWADMRKRTLPETEAEHPFEVQLPALK